MPHGPDGTGGQLELPSSKPWRLGAHPAAISRSAQSWRDVANDIDRTRADLASTTTILLAEWSGAASAAYRARHGALGSALGTVGTVAVQASARLDHAAAILRRGQSLLDSSWERVRRDPTAATVAAETAAAHAIRGDVLVQLTGAVDPLVVDRGHLTGLFPTLETLDEHSDTGWAAAPELTGMPRVIEDGDRVIVSGTASGELIDVGRYPDGQQWVRIGGVGYTFPADKQIVVRAGGGFDTVRVKSDRGVTVLGGNGMDRIEGGGGDDVILGGWDNDQLLGLGGNDVVYGGTGIDYITGGVGDDLLDGGADQDVLYGLDGDDSLWGSDGRDYLDGGSGVDHVDGGRDDDVVFGGRGADTMAGGYGDDVLAGGEGVDSAVGGEGRDTVYAQHDDAASAESVVGIEPHGVSGITVNAGTSAELQARTLSDLEAMRSVPAGQQMLDAIARAHQNNGDNLLITELQMGTEGETGQPRDGAPVGAQIFYDPDYTSLSKDGVPNIPLIHLFHEMGHVYDDFYDSAVPGSYNEGGFVVNSFERAVVGLPVDADQNPATPDTINPGHPYGITENALRDQLGLPQRHTYHGY